MKNFLISVTFFVALHPAWAAGYFDWQGNIDASCKSTISGRAKGVFSKYGFWFDTAVSMDMWADFMRSEPPQEVCKINYDSNKDQVSYMQCMAYIQDKWDWYRRCKPVIEQLAREESGKK